MCVGVVYSRSCGQSTDCGFESSHGVGGAGVLGQDTLTQIASLHPGVKWVPVRVEMALCLISLRALK